MGELNRKERERNQREKDILKAAESVFGEKGYDGSSMDEIASRAQFTKRTLYKYFPNKMDLYFAIALRAFQATGKIMSEAGKESKNAYEQLYKGCVAQYELSKRKPQIFRIISEVGYVRRKEGESKNRDEWYKYDDLLFEGLAKLIEKGQEDGSIKAQLDPKMTAFSCGFLISGLFKTLSESGETFSDHFDLDVDKFSKYTFDLLFSSIKA